MDGCQSLSTIYATSGKIAQKQGTQGALLLRFYEIPDIELGDSISVNTNSQSAVKPRDLRSNDKAMRQIKQRYESEVDHAYFITKRGEDRPSDKDPNRCIDSPDYAKWSSRGSVSDRTQRQMRSVFSTNITRSFSALNSIRNLCWP